MSDISFEEINDALVEDSGQERLESEYPWIVFAVDGVEYGINSKYVLSIEILGKVTPVVDTPHYCPGITEFRNDMIHLLDLRALFGLGTYLTARQDRTDERSMMVVVEVDGKTSGMIVDSIVSVEYITRFLDDIMSAETASRSQHVRQVAKREKVDTPVLILKHENLGSL